MRFDVDLFIAVALFGGGYACFIATRGGPDAHAAMPAARAALASNDRRRIEDVLITYRLPRKVRKQMEARCKELLADEIVARGRDAT